MLHLRNLCRLPHHFGNVIRLIWCDYVCMRLKQDPSYVETFLDVAVRLLDYSFIVLKSMNKCSLESGLRLSRSCNSVVLPVTEW